MLLIVKHTLVRDFKTFRAQTFRYFQSFSLNILGFSKFSQEKNKDPLSTGQK